MKIPTISELAEVLEDLQTQIEGDEEVDVRLQVLPNSWEVHLGDPQYDTDHRGWWSASSISPKDDPAVVAEDLLRQLE